MKLQLERVLCQAGANIKNNQEDNEQFTMITMTMMIMKRKRTRRKRTRRQQTTTQKSPLLHLAYILLLLIAYLSSPTQSLSIINKINTKKGAAAVVRPEICIAKLPSDLPAIQECRRSAYADRTNLFTAAQSFCNADQIQKEGYICIIAKAKNGKVLGTADLNTKRGIVNNVYVREEARKQGIARLMMEGVESAMEKPSTLKLTVMSKNVPAVSLYKSLGFQASGVVNGGLDALSSITPFDLLLEMKKNVVLS